MPDNEPPTIASKADAPKVLRVIFAKPDTEGKARALIARMRAGETPVCDDLETIDAALSALEESGEIDAVQIVGSRPLCPRVALRIRRERGLDIRVS